MSKSSGNKGARYLVYSYARVSTAKQRASRHRRRGHPGHGGGQTAGQHSHVRAREFLAFSQAVMARALCGRPVVPDEVCRKIFDDVNKVMAGVDDDAFDMAAVAKGSRH